MELESFFERYTRVFAERNLSNIIEFYSFPVVFYLEDGSFLLMNKEEFMENGKQLITQYDTIGMKSANFRLSSVISLNPSCSLVDINWELLDSNEKKLVEFVTRYVIGTKNDQSKILSVFLVNEGEVISAFLSDK